MKLNLRSVPSSFIHRRLKNVFLFCMSKAVGKGGWEYQVTNSPALTGVSLIKSTVLPMRNIKKLVDLFCLGGQLN